MAHLCKFDPSFVRHVVNQFVFLDDKYIDEPDRIKKVLTRKNKRDGGLPSFHVGTINGIALGNIHLDVDEEEYTKLRLNVETYVNTTSNYLPRRIAEAFPASVVDRLAARREHITFFKYCKPKSEHTKKMRDALPPSSSTRSSKRPRLSQ